MNKEGTAFSHTLYLQNRDLLQISGVSDVISFDDVSVVLSTAGGMLSIDGTELCVKKLDTEKGEVCIVGRLCGIVYLDDGEKEKKTDKRRRGLFH